MVTYQLRQTRPFQHQIHSLRNWIHLPSAKWMNVAATFQLLNTVYTSQQNGSQY